MKRKDNGEGAHFVSKVVDRDGLALAGLSLLVTQEQRCLVVLALVERRRGVVWRGGPSVVVRCWGLVGTLRVLRVDRTH